MIMGLPLKGSHMGAETGRLLGEISADEVKNGRPMLSALALNVNGEPGSGFFHLARDLGMLQNDEDEQLFLDRQRDDVYDTWKRPLME